MPMLMNFEKRVKSMNPDSGTRTIKVDYLARVEGEGGMVVKIKNNTVKDV